MLDVLNGEPRVRQWPKKRGPAKTVQHQEQTQFFRDASWAAKLMHPDMQKIFVEGRVGTALLPRDLAFMMLAGTMMGFVTPTGKVIYPMQSVAKVSESLDALAQTPGMFLVRGQQFWEAAHPPAAVPWNWAPPVPALFTLLSGDLTQLILTYDPTRGTSVDCGNPTGGDRQRIAVQAIPSPSGDWTLDFQMLYLTPNVNYSGAGIWIRDSIGGRNLSFQLQGNGELTVNRWSSLSGYNATPFAVQLPASTTAPYFRVQKIGPALFFYISSDGQTWSGVYSEAATAYLQNVPDLIGFGCFYNRTTGFKQQMNVQQWSLT